MPSWAEILEQVRLSAQQNQGRANFDSIRREYLIRLHQHTGRDTILYATRFTAQDAPSQLVSIGDEDLTGIMTVVHGLRSPNLDLILHSPGGSIEAAESLVEYLRSKFRNIRVIVPQLALSAATMMACGSNSLLLGKHSFLGPSDPQVLLQTPLGTRYVPAQAIVEQFEMAINECQDPKRLAAWLPMLNQYGPHLLVACENATRLSKELVSRWLVRWMFRGMADRQKKADRIADWLSNHANFFSHGRHITRQKLQQKGLRIERLEADQQLQDLVLSAFHATTHTFSGTPAAKIIENHIGTAFVKMSQAQQVVQLPFMPQLRQPLPQQQAPPATAFSSSGYGLPY